MSAQYEGLGFAFRRYYNSQSPHTAAASGDGVADFYGDGWTNTFDAHLVLEPGNVVSVYDETGARYDYQASGNTFTSITPGQYATLISDGTCGDFWTLKNGQIVYFYRPDIVTACGAQYAGLAGRIYQLIGRNNNTRITLNYSWNNITGNAGAYAGNTISQIEAVTDNAQLSAQLNFSTVNGQYQLLTSLVRPDGSTVSYEYNQGGSLLTDIIHPANNFSQVLPDEQYAYSGGLLPTILLASSPRWVQGAGQCTSNLNVSCGAMLEFGYSGSSTRSAVVLSQTWLGGYTNPTVPDGTNSGPLQPNSPTGNQIFVDEGYTLAALPSVGSTAQSTASFWDSAGHTTNWVADGFGRIVQTQSCTATTGTAYSTCTGQYLISQEQWDSNNNLLDYVDPRGYATGNALAYETSYAYDAAGNLTAVAQPSVTTSQGTIRPTQLLSYDAFNNVTASCDPNRTNALGLNWTTPPAVSDSLCPNSSGSVVTGLQYSTYEPYGEITAVTSASGYIRNIAYSAGAQGGTDYGQPTSIQGAAITQADGTNRQPITTVTYDSTGRPTTVSSGNGSFSYTYDAMGRLLTATDPDLASVKALTQTYYPDGSLATTQTPSEAAAGVSQSYAYDLDANLVSRTANFGNTVGTWQYWYDGIGTLVEQSNPADPNTRGDYTGLTKYYYDWSQGAGETSGFNTAVTAHGNLFDSYRYVATASTRWQEAGFSDYDALDRITANYSHSICPNTGTSGAITCSEHVYVKTYGYDLSSSSVGMLGSYTIGGTITKSYAYDSRGLLTGVQYSGDGGVTPAMQYVYDADGSPASLQSATLGTENLTYSPDELLQGVQESAAMGGGTLTYAYYGDGLLQSQSVGGPLLSQANLLNYSYRPDGLLSTLNVNYTGGATIRYAYTAGGRVTSMTDFSGSPSRTQSYDTYGRLSQYTIPAGSYSNLTYDAEGELTGYSGYAGEAVSLLYNVRGNLISQTFSPNGTTNGYSNFPAFSVPNIQGVPVQSSSEAWDAVTGAPVGYGSGSSFTYDYMGRMVQTPGGTNFTYDAEGRLLTGFADPMSTMNPNVSCGVGNNGSTQIGADPVQPPSAPVGGSYTKYAYGPDGSVASDPAGRRWHWSGGVPLYTDQGTVNGINIGALGVLPIGNSLSVNDLESNGLIASKHNATGFGNWAPPNPNDQACVTQTVVPPSSGYVASSNGAAQLQINGDGTIDDGFNVQDASGAPQIAAALSRLLPSSKNGASYGLLASRRSALVDPDCNNTGTGANQEVGGSTGSCGNPNPPCSVEHLENCTKIGSTVATNGPKEPCFDPALCIIITPTISKTAGGSGKKQNPKSQDTPSPCDRMGNAKTPDEYAAIGRSALGPLETPLFGRGLPLDAQAFGASTAYANYAYGVYFAAGGYSFPFTMGGAQLYARLGSSYPNLKPQDFSSDYPGLPNVNAINITWGFMDEIGGTLCSR